MTKELLDRLQATKSEREWNVICDEVKAANGGGYPDDWYAKVVMSGLLNRTAASWTEAS